MFHVKHLINRFSVIYFTFSGKMIEGADSAQKISMTLIYMQLMKGILFFCLYSVINSSFCFLMEAAGTNMDNVVKTTVFIKEMNDFSAINEVYKTFFTADFPSRSCVEVARLPKDVMLEIEAIAIK